MNIKPKQVCSCFASSNIILNWQKKNLLCTKNTKNYYLVGNDFLIIRDNFSGVFIVKYQKKIIGKYPYNFHLHRVVNLLSG